MFPMEDEQMSSPVVKSIIDFSLHQFEMLEQKCNYEAEIQKLLKQIEQIQVQNRQELTQIHEARTFEEKMLMQQMEVAAKKAESRIETIHRQFEERLQEANEWKCQAQNVGTLTTSVAEMQKTIKVLSEKLEKSQGLEEKLIKAESEIKRLEDVCDAFDMEELRYKEKIAQLQNEIKTLKGMMTTSEAMGFSQQTRLGIEPLSGESSGVGPLATEDGFEDAHEFSQC